MSIIIKKEKNMFDIKCKRINCEFNKDCNCDAKDLTVSKSAECKTFKPNTTGEISHESKIGQPAFRKNIIVECKAGCLFNESNQCIANGITVQTCENKDCPNCVTFNPN